MDIHAGNDVTNSSDNDRVRDDFYKEAAKKHKCLLWVQNIDVYENMEHLDVCPSTAGRIWLLTGIVTTIPSVIVMALVFHKEIDTIGWTGGIIVLLQCAVMCLPLVFTERAVKTEFRRIWDETINRNLLHCYAYGHFSMQANIFQCIVKLPEILSMHK